MKKFTKVVSVLLVLAMTMAMFTACGSKTEEAAAEGSAAEAEGGQVVKFGTNAEFPPFEFVAQDGVIGEYDGIDMAIAKKIGEDNGFDVQIENIEFDSLIMALSNGQIDAIIAGMTATEERAKSVDFSTTYYKATQVMIVKEDSDVASAADLANKKICVVQGYTGETVVNDLGYTKAAGDAKPGEYIALKKGTECILDLVNGKSDVVVIDSATAQKYVGDNEGLKIVEDEAAFGAEEYAIAVKKGNTELLEKINASVEKMLEDGTISDLAVQYTEAE